jgi:hypothetical protein
MADDETRTANLFSRNEQEEDVRAEGGRESGMGVNPLDDEFDPMHLFFSGSHGEPGSVPHGKGAPKERPEHYKVVSVSLYKRDLALIDELVKRAKQMGYTKMNRSAIIRFAVDTVDLTKLPKQY